MSRVAERQDGGAWSYRACGPGERLTLTSGAELDIDAPVDGVLALPGDARAAGGVAG